MFQIPKTSFFTALILCLATASSPSSTAQISSKRFPAPATPFTAESLQPTNLHHFRGKVVVLNLWTTWCGPCAKEIPSLQRLAKRLPADKFAVVAVNQDGEGASTARAFLEKHGVTDLPVYLDPKGRLAQELTVQSFPSSFVIVADGTVVASIEGQADWDNEDLVDYLSQLIGG